MRTEAVENKGTRVSAEGAGTIEACVNRSYSVIAPPRMSEHVSGDNDSNSGVVQPNKGCVQTEMSDAEAVEVLLSADSGITPDLSRRGYRLVKRAFDIVASGIAVVVLFIPGVVLSAVICIKSPGAGPLYSQMRVGRLKKDGSYQLFRMWKFRSMVPHADEMLVELKDRNEADGPLFKINEGIWRNGLRSGWSGGVSGRGLGPSGTNLVRIVQAERCGTLGPHSACIAMFESYILEVAA